MKTNGLVLHDVIVITRLALPPTLLLFRYHSRRLNIGFLCHPAIPYTFLTATDNSKIKPRRALKTLIYKTGLKIKLRMCMDGCKVGGRFGDLSIQLTRIDLLRGGGGSN